MGVVINKPSPVTMDLVFEAAGSNTPERFQKDWVMMGGPVQIDRGFVVHTPVGSWQSSLLVTDDIAMTTSRDIIENLAKDHSVEKALITIGYSSWSKGQLERELGLDLFTRRDGRLTLTPAGRQFLPTARELLNQAESTRAAAAQLRAGSLPTVSVDFARRMARNTQLLLLEESHIGRVLDPAGGSWYVEDLTETLAAQAWANFQEIESRGGFRTAIDHIAGQIEAVRVERAGDIAHRRTAITGVNEFPNLAEAPLAQGDSSSVRRYAAAFEALRDRSDAYLERTGARPRVLLLPLGPLAENNIRATFATNLLASGGIETVNPGTVDAAGVAQAVTDAGTSIAVICGTDARYGAEVAAIVPAARAAGCEVTYLAGPQKAVADLPADARPEGYLTAKVDAVEELSTLLTRLGA